MYLRIDAVACAVVSLELPRANSAGLAMASRAMRLCKSHLGHDGAQQQAVMKLCYEASALVKHGAMFFR